jgi:methylated-DNA-protein-cysteine methyltransferase-like protein
VTSGAFFRRVYAFVRRVPKGRVVTYGQVAALLGVPRGARAVGWALRGLDPAGAARVPWHRVVGQGGRISLREGPGGLVQRRRLRAEGVRFVNGKVDMSRHGLGGARKRPITPEPRRAGPARASRD